MKKIYISRRDSSRRKIDNEEAVIKFFSERGFEILELSKLTVAEQINIFAGADTVVAAHGAGLTNAIYCHQDVKIIEFMPRSYQNPCFLRIGQILKKDWRICVFDSETITGDLPLSNKVGSWHVDLDQLSAALQD